MALNSLYPDGWFALGAAALKVSCVTMVQDQFDLHIMFYILQELCYSYYKFFFSIQSSFLILIQARDIEKALDGFTRAVQLDPDNGEAWNNIACL